MVLANVVQVYHGVIFGLEHEGHLAICHNLEDILQCEISQGQKGKYCMNLCIGEIYRKKKQGQLFR